MIPDPCCGVCRSNTDICLSRRQCEHHRIAAVKQRAEDNRPSISYRDPTGTTAVNNIMNPRRNK